MRIRPPQQVGSPPQTGTGNGAGSHAMTLAAAAERTVSSSVPAVAAQSPTSAPAGQRAAGLPLPAGGPGSRGWAARPVRPQTSRPSRGRRMC